MKVVRLRVQVRQQNDLTFWILKKVTSCLLIGSMPELSTVN